MPKHPKTRRLRALLPSLLLIVSLAPAGGAWAQDDYMGQSGGGKKNDFGRPGGYLALAVGGANGMFTGDFNVVDDFLDQAILIGLRGGQRFNRFVAFDVSLDYSVRGFEAEVPGFGSAELKSVTGFGNLKLYPFAGRIQPYALGGVGFVWGAANCYDTAGNPAVCGFVEEDVVFAGRAGGGLDIYITRNLALAAEIAYVIPTDTFKDLNYLSYTGHLLFRF